MLGETIRRHQMVGEVFNEDMTRTETIKVRGSDKQRQEINLVSGGISTCRGHEMGKVWCIPSSERRSEEPKHRQQRGCWLTIRIARRARTVE